MWLRDSAENTSTDALSYMAFARTTMRDFTLLIDSAILLDAVIPQRWYPDCQLIHHKKLN